LRLTLTLREREQQALILRFSKTHCAQCGLDASEAAGGFSLSQRERAAVRERR
jgi:hypothetical protein